MTPDASPQVDWVRSEHLNLHGSYPQGLWMAPGRVNVIGEHTDYNNGFVLPFALENAVIVGASPRSDKTFVVSSRQMGTSSFDLDDLSKGRLSHAKSAIQAALEECPDLVGMNLVVDSNIPIGSGLSSSAAFVCALILAASDITGNPLSPETIATAARRAETEGVGVPIGVMDPMVSMCAKAGHALLLDCQTLDIEHIPLRVSVEVSPAMIVIDTRTPRRLVGGEYADRRRACHDAADALGVESLRDASLETLDVRRDRLSDEELRRARHVITENIRVVAAVKTMRDDRFEALGELLIESHRSLADDFEVSIPELDTAVDAAIEAGAHGARMTGAGFGGCAIALVPPDRTPQVKEAVASAFRERDFEPPGFLPAKPSAGAHRID